MEETKMTIEEYLNKITDDASFYKSFSRTYVPYNEKDDIMNLALTIIFGTFDSEGNLTSVDEYQEPNTLIDDLYIKTSIIKAYTGINDGTRIEIYDAFMKDDLYEKMLDEIQDARDFSYMFARRINEKREYIKENRKSASDEMLDMFTTLLSTINDKAKEIDMKKIDKMLKKLNVNELLKKYKESGIGDSMRDQTIQKQAIEIKELKNKISAANVVADK